MVRRTEYADAPNLSIRTDFGAAADGETVVMTLPLEHVRGAA